MSSGLRSFSEAQFLALRRDSASDIESYILDADGLDAVFLLYVITLYFSLRLAFNLIMPGLHEKAATKSGRQYSRQQYMMVFLHKGFILPLCGLGWQRGFLPPELVYLLTGAYVVSDSMVNARPVRGGSWGGNIGVHAHHIFTLLLCTVGAHLEAGPVNEGAFVILVGEVGSLFLTVTILHPTPLNVRLRFFTFVLSRLIALYVGLGIVRATADPVQQLVLVAVIAFLSYDNFKTLRAMSGSGGFVAAGSLGRSDSLAAELTSFSEKKAQ